MPHHGLRSQVPSSCWGRPLEGVLLGGRLEGHQQECAGKERPATAVPREGGGDTVGNQVPHHPACVQGEQARQGHAHRPAEERPAKTSDRGGQRGGTSAPAHAHSERDGGIEQGDRTQCEEKRGGIVHVRAPQDAVHRICHVRIRESGDDQPQKDRDHHPGVGEDCHTHDSERPPPTVIRQAPREPVVGEVCEVRFGCDHLGIRGGGGVRANRVRCGRGRVCDLSHANHRATAALHPGIGHQDRARRRWDGPRSSFRPMGARSVAS